MNEYPISIAAGMIKSAAHVEQGLLDLVHSIVFGSFTLEPREGNKEPVFWYNQETGGSINAVGLKNRGLQHFLDMELPLLVKMTRGELCKIVISLAPLKRGDLGKMLEMIRRSKYRGDIFRIEINAACPNHRDGSQLHPILAHDPVAVAELLKETQGFDSAHLALKIAPDTDYGALQHIVTLCENHHISHIVSGNTRRVSSVIDGVQRLSVDHGGLAGDPLLEPALEQVKQLQTIIKTSKSPVKIIGCGGGTSADALWKHREAGAAEVQVATWYYLYQLQGMQDLLLAFHSQIP